MVKDHKDPYNPCEAASFVAKRVTAAADELRKLDKWSGVAAPPYKDADKMWMQAVQNAAIMASPTLSAAVCTPRASATVAGKGQRRPGHHRPVRVRAGARRRPARRL